MISERLKNNLDNIQEHVKEKNLDWVHVNEGSEGTGKSALSLSMAVYLDDEFNAEKQIAFSAKEFRQKASKLDPYKPIIFDEGIDGLYSRNAMTKENKRTVKFLRKCREMNLFIFINLPQFTELDKSIRNKRTKSVGRCVKQGWAWIFGQSQISQIEKQRNDNVNYPDPYFKTSWKDPANTMPEIWENYQEQKIEDITDLKEDQEEEDDTEWISTGKFADIVDVSPRTVRDWCDAGKISCSKLPNGDRRIPKKESRKVLQ